MTATHGPAGAHPTRHVPEVSQIPKHHYRVFSRHLRRQGDSRFPPRRIPSFESRALHRACRMQPPKAESGLTQRVSLPNVNAGATAFRMTLRSEESMKKMLVLLSLGVLGASLALAQETSPTGQSATPTTDPPASASTVQGCLSGSDGSYMLTQDGTGTTYKLVGDEPQLIKHVGHEVAITGELTGSSGSAGSAPDQGQAGSSSGTASGTAIQVSAVKMISRKCSSGGGTSQSN